MKKLLSVASIAAVFPLIAACEGTFPGRSLTAGNFICSKGDTKIKIDAGVLDKMSATQGPPGTKWEAEDIRKLANYCTAFLAGDMSPDPDPKPNQ